MKQILRSLSRKIILLDGRKTQQIFIKSLSRQSLILTRDMKENEIINADDLMPKRLETSIP